MTRYLLFCRLSERQGSDTVLPAEIQSEYLGVTSIFRPSPAGVWVAIAKWWLFAALVGHPTMPKVLIFRAREKVVHYSFVLPRLGRIPGMRRRDLEIGPCWTHPDHRGRQLFQLALRTVCSDFAREGRAFWMVCRRDNLPSKAAIAKMGFTQVATCDRRPYLRSMVHLYAIGARPAPDQSQTETPTDWRDTQEERVRYNQSANRRQDAAGQAGYGPASVPEALRAPYTYYHGLIGKPTRGGMVALDVCCGDGNQTIPTGISGYTVIGIDIAEASLKLARKNAQQAGFRMQVVACHAGVLPFASAQFDLVTCAGGLSYVNNADFLLEAVRVLRPDGLAIFVDSFNENPLYRLNRWRHWLNGSRSRNTLNRIPDLAMLQMMKVHFGRVETRFFGVLAFLSPLLTVILGESRTAAFVDWADTKLPYLRHMAFKIVIVATHPKSVNGAQDQERNEL